MDLLKIRLVMVLATAGFAVPGLGQQTAGNAPINVMGGFVEFSPVSRDYDGNASSGNTVFPLPAKMAYPGAAVMPLNPAIYPSGDFYLPVDPQGEPAKTGDFPLEGGIAVGYPNQKIWLSFIGFRVATDGKVYAGISVNGQPFNGEIELLDAVDVKSGPTADGKKWILSATLVVSPAFAEAINRIFQAPVLVLGEKIATEYLEAYSGNP